MGGLLVVAEHLQGELRDITGELIGAAAAVKDRLGGPLMVAVIGDEPAAYADKVNLKGVDEILAVSVGSPHFDASIYEEATCRIAASRRPRAIFLGHTSNGMAFGPAAAARLGSGFASDVFAIDGDGGEIVATRGAYGGKVNVELGFPGKTIVTLMVRAATFKAPDAAGSAKVVPVEVDASGLSDASTHVGYTEAPPADVDIGKAEFIVSVGRGVEDKDNVPRFAALAERLGAALGCSRPVSDSGWLPRAHQVGQSGTIAANCKLYLALGISGAVQHLTGMKHVETIIAVNADADAPIFDVATYGACMDLFELTEALEKEFH
ncbi:MAG: electron transfer flavoprotein subunit alpha/FixB family protein [Alphaproteobacteria bacterium]